MREVQSHSPLWRKRGSEVLKNMATYPLPLPSNQPLSMLPQSLVIFYPTVVGLELRARPLNALPRPSVSAPCFLPPLTPGQNPCLPWLTSRQPPCHLCSGRAPHGASSSYLTVGASTAEGDTPSGAPAGSIFAVMDPSPCPCTIERAGKAGQEGGRDRNGGTGSSRGGGGGGGGEGMYHPRLLWPVRGSKFAYSAGHGPVEHPLKLRSAYSQQADAWGTGEPAFTSYHHMFKVRLVVCYGR